MTEEIVIKVEGEQTSPAAPLPVVVVVDTPAPVENDLSEADAIELAELRREKQERIEADAAAALMAANLALEIANQEEEVIVPPVEEESKEEEKPDTPPDRTHAFFREF